MEAFTPNKTTAFLTNSPHMDQPKNIRARLVLEGLVNFNNFNNFKEDQLNQPFKNMRTAIPGITSVADSGGDEAIPAVDPDPPVMVYSKCSLSIKVSLIAYHY